MSLTNIYEAFDINSQINPAYNGPLFQVGHYNGSYLQTYDVPQNANGKVDLSALEAWANGRVVGLLQIYGQYGQQNLQWGDDGNLTSYSWTNNQFIKIYDGTNFVFGANGLLDLQNVSWWFFTSSNVFDIATFSFFMRMRGDASQTGYARGLLSQVSEWGNDNAILHCAQGATSTPITLGFGTPSYFKNGAVSNVATKGDVYTEFQTDEYINIGITNVTTNNLTSELSLFRGRSGFEWYGDPSTILIYTGDVSADVDSINTLINAVNENFTTMGGEITLSGVAIPDAIVNIMRATNPFDQSTHELVETVIADGNGVYTATLDTDTLYDYWASPVGFVSEFTGTITSVGGTGNVELTLPSDLSGLNIGGANNDLYVIKATGGAGSGNAVAVTGRTGNTITVAVNPGFTDTTVYDLGKAYFPGKLLSKTETA